jgi:hypothetical protein
MLSTLTGLWRWREPTLVADRNHTLLGRRSRAVIPLERHRRTSARETRRGKRGHRMLDPEPTFTLLQRSHRTQGAMTSVLKVAGISGRHFLLVAYEVCAFLYSYARRMKTSGTKFRLLRDTIP